MALTAVGAFLKVIVWVAALALFLSALGFDVTAIVAGLGIGGLAIGLAAQPMIADVIGAVVIFAERRFRIGDVVKLGSEEPGRVVGLTWRSTAMKNADGLVISVPNRKVTETTVQNLTREGHAYDALVAASGKKLEYQLQRGQCHRDFAWLLIWDGRPADAEREYRQAIAQEPGYAVAYVNLAASHEAR